MKIALGIEYDGTLYHGWQKQPHNCSIQAALEKAIAYVANEKQIEVVCAGRTDAGVHALGQVIHFDTEATRPEKAWIAGVNSVLPHDIVVTWAQIVDASFHARFSAVQRRYCYLIYNHKIPSALWRNRMNWLAYPLDETLMQKAAIPLIGEHDFSSFRAAECQSMSPNRCIYEITITRQAQVIKIEIAANAFLHHMVRNIVGTLVEVGRGKQSTEWVQKVLDAKDRTQAGMTMSSHGLYLMKVTYPEAYHFPENIHGIASLSFS